MNTDDYPGPSCGGCAAARDAGAAGPHSALRAHELHARQSRDRGDLAAAVAVLRCALDRYAGSVRGPSAAARPRMLLAEMLFGLGDHGAAEAELAGVYSFGRRLAETGDTAAAVELVAGVVTGLAGVVADDHQVLVRSRQLYRDLTAA